MAKKIVFGEIPGIKIGDWFKDRKEIMDSSIHRNLQAGIDGNKNEGVAAIVLSGGYEDDMDLGNEIIYTGAGGNKEGKQIEDQSLENTYNRGLYKSMIEGLPVRVVRGHQHKSEFSPKKGYTYAGLFTVVDFWIEKGKSGFKVCRFRLESIDNPSVDNLNQERFSTIEGENLVSERKQTTILRIVRDSAVSGQVKDLYNHECQVCGTILEIESIRYAEGAHIKPLGRPHNGEDKLDNILCLCPNDHILFDRGAFTISDTFDLIGDKVDGKLKVSSKHPISTKNLKYHRESHGFE
ncbi:YDG/SRA domain-containing protein [Myroides odoratus]|uniref:Predicted restriction endonuclease n=1 Tax=Myroides odoratus TaxID=256 RepID=A0A378RKT5_MYROD|nr:YDG/SRA domain-containing protein [Myroides odoratus]QQU02120.1 HNH endonuclease [Myroides odoratus]STZ26979.1 Predicted restriction endonuclease [Myroides odoratus]